MPRARIPTPALGLPRPQGRVHRDPRARCCSRPAARAWGAAATPQRAKFAVRRANAAQQADAVIGLLTAEYRVIARSLNIHDREISVLDLRFLKAQNVHLVGFQPIKHVGQADF